MTDIIPWDDWWAKVSKLAKDAHHLDLEEDPCGWRHAYEGGLPPELALEQALFGSRLHPQLPDFEIMSSAYNQSLSRWMLETIIDRDCGVHTEEQEEDPLYVRLEGIPGVTNADYDYAFGESITYDIAADVDFIETCKTIEKTILDYINTAQLPFGTRGH